MSGRNSAFSHRSGWQALRSSPRVHRSLGCDARAAREAVPSEGGEGAGEEGGEKRLSLAAGAEPVQGVALAIAGPGLGLSGNSLVPAILLAFCVFICANCYSKRVITF